MKMSHSIRETMIHVSWFTLVFLCLAPVMSAQEVISKRMKVAPDGQPVPVPPGQPPTDGQPAPPGAPGDAKPDGAKPDAAKPGEAAKAPDGPIKRKSEPPEPPNKREFDIKPDEEGLLQFQFRNQGWPDLMKWLAEVSGMSLDWQELPNDYLNIATQKKHTLEQTRDLFNRHLLARGFTMLEFDGTIQILKTAGINAALVPKVEPQALASLPPNRFVRVSFPLDTLIAADVVTELKPLISSNGSLNALAATNRLEAMDTAANLHELNRILSEEQSQKAQDGLAREYVLEHVRAMDVREQLLQFLGIESKKKGPMNPQEAMAEMQQQQMMMQQQQQMAQQGGAQPPTKKSKSETYIVANIRRNSVIVHASPDKMAIISAFIKRVDVANENGDNLQTLQTRTQVYRLASLDPKQLVSSLIAMDALEPTTRLEVDEKNKAIIAYASVYDHFVIKKMIERLDGSAREVEVIQLRRLRAEDVVGTIKFLMTPEKKDDDSSRRRNYFYYDPFGNNDKKDTNNDGFRVAANSQDNQVLIWANEIERADVKKLLIKLGELPPEGGNRNRVRIIDANRSNETKEYLKRLQEAWNRVSPDTPLVLPSEEQFEKPDSVRAPGLDNPSQTDEAKEVGESNKTKKAEKNKDVSDSQKSTRIKEENLARLGIPPGKLSSVTPQPPEETEDEEAVANNSKRNLVADNRDTETEPKRAAESRVRSDVKTPFAKAPIEISFDEKGNLVLVSEDTEALSKLEQLMIDNAPPQRGYEVFKVKHTKPSWIKWNLEDYFKEEKKGKSDSDAVFRWIFDMDAPSKKDNDDPQLGKKRKLKFLSDNDTNTLIIIGADDAQLKTIEGLIRLWDVPEKTNKKLLRYSKLIHIEYSKAEVVVEAIKDAYRDLLSSNDKAFQKEKDGGGGGEGGGKEPKRGQATDSITDGAMNFRFTGYLSLGIDKLTNSIIVTAEGEDLLTLVCKMIEDLDEAAKPTGSVEILKLDGANAQVMEKALKALSKANAQQPNNADPNQQQQQQVQQNLQQQESNQNPGNPKRGNQRR